MANSPSPSGEGQGVGAVSRSSPDKPHPNPSPEGEGLAHPDKPVMLAAIAGAHGVTGEVRLKLFTDDVASLRRHKSFNDGTLTLERVRDDGKGGALASFAELADRTDAEKLRGTLLSVPRSAFPPLADGEYYHADLVGLRAVSDAGELLGTVIAVENFGAGDVLEIERPDGKRFMVPMTIEAVPAWDDERLTVAEAFAAG